MRRSLLVLMVLAAMPLLGQPAPIRYIVRFPAPQTHYVEVEAQVPTDGKAELDLMMPVWTPGSYSVREYARNVENLEGAPMEKTRKNHWRVRSCFAIACSATRRPCSPASSAPSSRCCRARRRSSPAPMR